jgi:hypothetical protein
MSFIFSENQSAGSRDEHSGHYRVYGILGRMTLAFMERNISKIENINIAMMLVCPGLPVPCIQIFETSDRVSQIAV